MNKIIASIYWVYKSRNQDIPYTRTMMTVVGILSLHIIQIFLIFNIPSKYILPFELKNDITERWLNASILLTPMIFLFIIFFKEKKLSAFDIPDTKILQWKRWLPIYFLISFGLLIGLLIREGIRTGNL
jgi:hypothetical protein